MRFPPSFIDEIKTRVPVSDVVRRRVKLIKSGREWKGLSPFNSEKTPSFFVNDQKMAWFDFSSGRNGNVFDFLMATEGLSFPEAVERLAGLAGLPLPTISRETEEREKRRATMHEVLAEAARFFEAQLRAAAGSKARHYLAGRGLGQGLQTQFRLGYAPAEKYALRDALAARGADVETMIEAGLLIHGEDIAVPYDRFRDRVMFPIADRAGRIIAFGGRALDALAPAKYLNSPETPLFHKGAVLYNHHAARKAAQTAGGVIAVEGYVDVIALTAAGFPQAVAPLGTALTAEQLALLWQMSEEPTLCFDGDGAGRKAAFRAIETAWPLLGAGKSLRFALLPQGQDPDDLVRAGGQGAMAQVLSEAKPLSDLLWLRETAGETFVTPERRAALERRLTALAQDLQDPTLRRYYHADFQTRLKALFGTARPPYEVRASRENRRPFESGRGNRGNSSAGSHGTGFQRSSEFSRPMMSANLAQSALIRPDKPNTSLREALILLLLINHPMLIDPYAEEIAGLDIADPQAARLRDALLESTRFQNLLEIKEELVQAGHGPALDQLSSGGAQSAHWYVRPEAAPADAETVLKQALTLHRRARVLHKELQLAEQALANDNSEQNHARLCDIQEQLTALTGMEAAVEGFGAQSGRSSGSL